MTNLLKSAVSAPPEREATSQLNRARQKNADSLAAPESAGTVLSMATKRRSPVVARFEIVSNDPAAGEAYQHVVTVQRNGRVRSVVTCADREETIREWATEQPPTLEELADLLILACRDDFHESRVRLLSAVVHGLLPQGNYLYKKAAEIPDAVLDASLAFGPRTTYRAEIQGTLVSALQGKPDLKWARQVQTEGTDAHNEFLEQIDEASTADPEWLLRSTEASESSTDTPFNNLVSRSAPEALPHSPACACAEANRELGDLTEGWVCIWGTLNREMHDEHNGYFHLRACYGELRLGEVAAWLVGPEAVVLREIDLGTTEAVTPDAGRSKTMEHFADLVDEFIAEYGAEVADEMSAAKEDEQAATITIYWDSLYGRDFSLVPEGWEEENIAPLRLVAAASTWGEVRAVTKPYWLERLLESHVEDRDDAGVEITDTTPFRAADLGMDTSDLLDHMVVPWDLESLGEWLPEEDMDVIESHCRTGGASPGGHIDVYTPRDEEALVDALRARGHNVVQRDFLSDLEQALNGLSRQEPAPSSDVVAPTVFEQAGDTVVVHVDGDEVEWDDYVDEVPTEALILGFWNENGWGDGSDEVYLVAPGVVVESRVCDDTREQTLHENVTDVAGLALDRLDNSEMAVALAVFFYGPLFDGNTALPSLLLPMTPRESSPFAEGNDGEEMPELHWGFCIGATEEVRAEFRRRVDAGRYPLVAALLEVGSPAWREWVVGLLTAVPLSDRVAADGYPLVKDPDHLKGLSTAELLETATESLSRR